MTLDMDSCLIIIIMIEVNIDEYIYELIKVN